MKAFVKASLEGWKDTIANPKAAADIVVKHIKGLDPEVVLQEIVIVNALVATPDTRAKGLGTIDAKVMGDKRRPDRQEHRRRRQGRRQGRCTTRAPAAAADQAVSAALLRTLLDIPRASKPGTPWAA